MFQDRMRDPMDLELSWLLSENSINFWLHIIYAAALLGAIMVGAAATHAIHNEAVRVSAPLMWLGVVAFVGVARRRRAWRPGVRALPVPAGQV